MEVSPNVVGLIVVLAVTCIPLLVSLYYWRRALVYLGGEDLDGDCRRTAIGLQTVFHLRRTKWHEHVRWNRKAYLDLFVGVLLISLVLGAVAILASIAPPITW